MTGLLAVLVLLAPGCVVGDATEAMEQGRYADAVGVLERCENGSLSYDDLVSLGVARGRLGRLEQAEASFSQAIAVAPHGHEAWVERGGLHFLERRDPEAVRDLEAALEIRDDPYARDLLASSLFLAGQPDAALRQWNRLGLPVLRHLDLSGLVHTKDRVVRRELPLSEGALLDAEQLSESRLRIRELGIFDRVTFRPVPRGGEAADLEVALAERHGLAQNVWDLVTRTGINLLQHRAALSYSNVAGHGVTLTGTYRWEPGRPSGSLGTVWPRPFGLDAYLHARAFRGRQAYDLDEEPLDSHTRGARLTLRRVLNGSTVGAVGVQVRERSFSRFHPEAPSGMIAGFSLGLERGLVAARRHRLGLTANLFRTAGLLGSNLSYVRGVGALSYQALLAPPDGSALERSVLAARFLVGLGSEGTPLDDMFAPGASPELELPLRAHRQAQRGVLGETPLGRSLALLNVEWRHRLAGSTNQIGFVVFYDGAVVGRGPNPDQLLHDVGLGLRFSVARSTVMRVDYGYGLSDGSNALSIGLGRAF
jgi:outer membrane protein assembly factor BamA